MQNPDRLIDSMMLTDRMRRQIFAYYGKQLGITHSAHYILMLLERGKSPSQKEIADHLEITPAAVTGIVKKLETAGLITRTAGSDSRNNEISLSEEGIRFLAEKRKVFRSIDRINNPNIIVLESCFCIN